jgi:hypothetical protein
MERKKMKLKSLDRMDIGVIYWLGSGLNKYKKNRALEKRKACALHSGKH